MEVEINVNEQGQLAGERTNAPLAAYIRIHAALQQWRFRPLIRDGRPQYFQATVRLVVP